jgi:hypothetical protein
MTHLRTAALTVAALTIGVVIGLSLTAAADTYDRCPPPSAQLTAAQGNTPSPTGCAELDAPTSGTTHAVSTDGEAARGLTGDPVIEPSSGTTTTTTTTTITTASLNPATHN